MNLLYLCIILLLILQQLSSYRLRRSIRNVVRALTSVDAPSKPGLRNHGYVIKRVETTR